MILIRRCSYMKLAFFYGIKYCPREMLRILLRTLLEMKNNILFAVFDDNKIIGFAAARKLPKKYIFDKESKVLSFIVGPIRVEENYRKCGIGQMLLNNITEHIEKYKNAEHTYAYIGIANIPSQKLFKKCGFQNVGYMEKHNDKYYINQENGEFYLFKRNSIG